MLPTSVVGLTVLVFSLTPGFAFLQRREQYHSGRRYSVLRETSIVVVTSLVADLFATLAFMLVSNAIPGSRTATNALFAHGTDWMKHNYRSSLICGLAILTVASLTGFVAASPPAWIPGMKSGAGKRWRGSRQQISSAWTVAFSTNNTNDSPVLVGVELQNGSHLRGVLDHWSTDLDDHADRSLLLTRPLAIRVGQEFIELHAHYVEVSASQIRYMTATYVLATALVASVDGSPSEAPAPDTTPK